MNKDLFRLDDDISLIVGRGSVTQSAELGTWIPCDISPFVFINTPPPYLNIDFCSVSDLSLLSTGAFKRIVFDISTWRFMKLSPQVIQEWKRILDPTDGYLVFEAGLSSLTNGSFVSYDLDNPCHLIVPRSVYQFRGVHPRYIYSASSLQSLGFTLDRESLIAKEYKTQVTEWLKDIFKDWKAILLHSLSNSKVYPIETKRPITEWYQIFI